MIKFLIALFLFIAPSLFSNNQTVETSLILSEDPLPFTLQIDQATFSLPTGLQSFARAIYEGKWLLIAGRTNGLHGFDNSGNNFPPSQQNTTVYVIDPSTGNSWSRSLSDATSGLSQEEIDCLSVTAPQFFQKFNTLYVIGGYGINTQSAEMETKSTLTAINISQMMQWVMNGSSSAKQCIRQTSNPLLQVTGGYLFQLNDHEPFLLMLGQDFEGLYFPDSNGQYTMQIRTFWLNDNGTDLSFLAKTDSTTYADYRRRDLNIVPILRNNEQAYLALSGVFTESGGVWTVPITIFPDGSSIEPDPLASTTFKQGMNNYYCPIFGLYSVSSKNMYVVLSGGLSYGYFVSGVFTTDTEVPFINQVTAIQIDKQNNFTQYIMNGEYPVILSTGSNPGNSLLFGAEALAFPVEGLPLFSNGVIQFDALPSTPTIIGYIVGGIMSTLPNTNVITDSTASPYVFTVTFIPKTPS